MLRKRLPNLEFSPRLRSTVEQAAEPLPFNEVEGIFRDAGVKSSHDLGRIHSGSWHDTILSLENLASRKCTSAESATIRVTIDALCSRQKPALESCRTDTQKDDPSKESSHAVDPPDSQRDDPFFD